MKTVSILSFASCIAASLLAGGPARATALLECSQEQLRADSPLAEEVDSHRTFTKPSLSYPFGTKMENDRWGLSLNLGVDEAGAVVCHNTPTGSPDPYVERQRRAAIERVHMWRYRPFTRNGAATPAMIWETIREEEQPPKQRKPLPRVSLDKVHITLRRTICHGRCPDYRVDIHGDGRVTFHGERHVDVRGRRSYRVPREKVAGLVESLRASDIWSLRPVYRSSFSAAPTHVLTIHMGGQPRTLEDHAGDMAGMPASVDAFLEEVDRVARSDMWIRLSRESIEQLKAEGFDFTSPAAGDFLARAAANPDSRDEEAMLSLIMLGAPVDRYAPLEDRLFGKPRRVMEEALLKLRTLLIDPLLEKGALRTRGRPDQNKIDEAFRAAIASGRLAFVQKIWESTEERFQPTLVFEDISKNTPPEGSVFALQPLSDIPPPKSSPVTLLLGGARYTQGPWDGLAIAKWLAERGCDLKAAGVDGITLLHIAAEKGDAAFVRYLLAQGFDASTPGEDGLRALEVTDDEEIALALLEAGADLSDFDLRETAERKRWRRVASWLAARRG